MNGHACFLGIVLFLSTLAASAQPAPAEYPRAYANGELVTTDLIAIDTVEHGGGYLFRLESPYPNGHIFYSFESEPAGLLSYRYAQPFYLNVDRVLRVISYSSDYSIASEERRITIVGLPTFLVNSASFGQGFVFYDKVFPGHKIYHYTSNTVARLIPKPDPGWRFDHWSGDFSGTDNPLEFTVTTNVSVQAHFVPAGPQISAQRIQRDYILLQFSTIPELDYTVQSSPDLLTWSPGQTFIRSSGIVDAIVPIDRTKGHYFHRVVTTPRGVSPPY